MTDEFDSEPIPGLPQHLPPGEEILWQGSPTWRASALHSFHVRAVAFYFLVLVVWRLVLSLNAGATLLAAVASAALLMLVAIAAIGLFCLLGFMVARSTVYTITSKRVIMRFGMALPMAINLPFSMIRSAAFKAHTDGCGDLPLELAPGNKTGYLLMWPHVRPWHFSHPQPMLRGVPEAARVASLLSSALRAAHQATAAENQDAVNPATDRLQDRSAAADSAGVTVAA